MKQKVHFNIFYSLLAIAVVSIPFTTFLMLPIAILLLINWLIEWNWKEKFSRINTKTDKVLFFSLISFFAIGLIGSFYYFDLSKFLSGMENKIWFLLAPLLFFTANRNQLDRKKTMGLFYIYLLSSAVMVASNFVLSAISYFETHNPISFNYLQLSHFSHPSYSAMYITLALILSEYFLFLENNNSTWKKIILGCSLPYWIFYIIMLQSKAGILILLVTALLSCIYIIQKKIKKKGAILIVIFSFLLITPLFYKAAHLPMNRMSGLKTVILDLREKMNSPHFISDIKAEIEKNGSFNKGTYYRAAIWKMSSEVAIENLPWGVGTGNTKNKLAIKYEEHGFTDMATRRMDPHNQYLLNFIETGIPGILVLLAFFLIPLYHTIKNRDFMYFFFLLTIMMNILVESMLDRRMGGDFVALFGSLLCYNMLMNKNEVLELSKNTLLTKK